MQVPVVAYGTGGVAEGIDSGTTGYVLKTGDVAALAARLRELLTDDRKRRQMGEAGRRRVEERFSLGAFARRHEEFYLRILSSDRQPSA
jgi:glycosyltransferase involved in cell wall biosynthesis